MEMRILDGAMGTELMKRGYGSSPFPEEVNLTAPEVVQEIQRAYVEAGSQVLYTCTFGVNRRRVLAAEGVHREFKFSLLAPASLLDPAGTGETLLQGVVDCWLEEPDGLTVIDYKTDRVSRSGQAARAAEYAPQLRAYVWALERITGKRVNAAYLYFFSTGEAIRLDLGKE